MNKQTCSNRLDSPSETEKETQPRSNTPLNFLATVAAATPDVPSTKENLMDTKTRDDSPVDSLYAAPSLLGDKKPSNNGPSDARQSGAEASRPMSSGITETGYCPEPTQNDGSEGTAPSLTFPCGIPSCSATFDEPIDISYHLRVDHKPQEQLHIKPYVCAWPGCRKKYKNMNGLQYHMRLGTCSGTSARNTTPEEQTKPFQCPDPTCQKRYKNQSGLQYHMLKAKDNGHFMGMSSLVPKICQDSAVAPNHPTQVGDHPIYSSAIHPAETFLDLKVFDTSVTSNQRDTGEVTTYKAQQLANEHDSKDEGVRHWDRSNDSTICSQLPPLSSFARDFSNVIEDRRIDKEDLNVAHLPGLAALPIPTFGRSPSQSDNRSTHSITTTALPTPEETPTTTPKAIPTKRAAVINANPDEILQQDFRISEPHIGNETSATSNKDKIFDISTPYPSISLCSISSEKIGCSLSSCSTVVDKNEDGMMTLKRRSDQRMDKEELEKEYRDAVVWRRFNALLWAGEMSGLY